MNEILQQRIEEAAKKTACPQCVFNDGGTCNNDDDCKLFDDFVGLMTFALQNQWISVDEALPEEDIPNCFVAYKAMDMVLYSTGSYEKDNDEWYVDGVGFNAEVTHWMMIPTINNEEK